LGTEALVYGQGSLVSGYTDHADLDVVIWDGDVPGERGAWVSSLHDDGATVPFTNEDERLALDRFVRRGQEFNLSHHPMAWFDRMVAVDLDGPTLARDIRQLQVRSGFVRGIVMHDRLAVGTAAERQVGIETLPDRLCAEACRAAINDWAHAEGELHKARQREDWLVLFSV
jgi:hypothetical protein